MLKILLLSTLFGSSNTILVLNSEIKKLCEYPVPQIINLRNYFSEIHKVVTSDGYVLTVHRIPFDKYRNEATKGPIILMHGLMDSSYGWTAQGQALAYQLADLGYDVWIPNSRGNRYSLEHIDKYKSFEEPSYWTFSFHEMGFYDLPAVIDYILYKTKYSNLHFIGHSQGCSIFLVMASKRPEYNSKISEAILFAPGTYLDNSNSIFVNIGRAPIVYSVIQSFGYGPLWLYVGELQQTLSKVICGIFPSVCIKALSIAVSSKLFNFNQSLILPEFCHFPCGSSIQNYKHFEQIARAGIFAEYNPLYKQLNGHGLKRYNLSQVSAPVYLFYSRGDHIISYKDIPKLTSQLPNLKLAKEISDPFFSHFDFVLGLNVNIMLYNQVLSILNNTTLIKT